MVNTLLNSLKLLRDVLVLFLFFLCVMALIGLQLFVGQLHNKCVSRSSSNANERYVTNESKFAFSLTGLAGPTNQFLNGTYEFSEMVLARMALLMDQSRAVLPLRSAKAREFVEFLRKKCTRALDFLDIHGGRFKQWCNEH